MCTYTFYNNIVTEQPPICTELLSIFADTRANKLYEIPKPTMIYFSTFQIYQLWKSSMELYRIIEGFKTQRMPWDFIDFELEQNPRTFK